MAAVLFVRCESEGRQIARPCLRELHAVPVKSQAGLKDVGSSFHIVRGRNGTFVVLSPGLPLDIGPERDHPLVLRQCSREPGDVFESGSHLASQTSGESLLFPFEPLLLQFQCGCGTARRMPGPGTPLHLESSPPECIRRGAKLIQARQTYSGLTKRREQGPVLGAGELGFGLQAHPRLTEAVEFRARSQRRQRPACESVGLLRRFGGQNQDSSRVEPAVHEVGKYRE
jgi:hypothetical protein